MKSAVLIVITLLVPLPKPMATDTLFPEELEGVWVVSAVLDDGVEQPLARDPDGSVEAGECAYAEIVICRNRIVMVKTDGSSTVGKATVVAIEPEVKIKVTTGIYHDKTGDTSYAVLKRVGDELVLAWGPSEMRKVDNKKGGGQIVMTAGSE